MKLAENVISIVIDEKVLTETELASLMFESLVRDKIESEDKEIIKKILIDGFKQRLTSSGFELNNGTDIEQLSLLYQEKKGHISLTEIDLLSVDQGFDIITFNDILHLSEVKSSLQQNGISREKIIEKYIESIKSQLCNKRKITNQLLNTMKIVSDTNFTKEQIGTIKIALSRISEVNISSTENITSLHNSKEIKLQSFVIASSSNEEFCDFLDAKKTNMLLKSTLKSLSEDNKCPFCQKKKCMTIKQIENLKIKYDIYIYRINDKFSTKNYLNDLINLIEEY